MPHPIHSAYRGRPRVLFLSLVVVMGISGLVFGGGSEHIRAPAEEVLFQGIRNEEKDLWETFLSSRSIPFRYRGSGRTMVVQGNPEEILKEAMKHKRLLVTARVRLKELALERLIAATWPVDKHPAVCLAYPDFEMTSSMEKQEPVAVVIVHGIPGDQKGHVQNLLASEVEGLNPESVFVLGADAPGGRSRLGERTAEKQFDGEGADRS